MTVKTPLLRAPLSRQTGTLPRPNCHLPPVPAGRERSALPLLRARFARWDPLLQLQASDLDFENDGVMLPSGTAEWNRGVYHYVR